MTLEGWNYRKSHVITHTSITDYQTKIRVYRTIGTDSGDTVYVGDKCRTDFGDIRFTNSVGTELPYWMETSNATYADFWVKLDNITTSATFYIYYGNSSATTTSNGETTFEFFDDFSSGTIGSKWTKVQNGTLSITDGKLTCAASSNNVNSVSSTTTYGTNTALRIRAAQTLTIYSWMGYTSGSWGTTYAVVQCQTNSSQHSVTYNASSEAQSISSPSASYQIYDICRGASNVIFKVNDIVKNTHSTQVSSASAKIEIGSYASGSSLSVDYIALRSYNSTEPTHSTWGTEQDIGATSFTIRITPTTGTDPLSVTYNCIIPEGTLNNFTLSYGDGNEYTAVTQSSFVTTHVYNEPGTYTVWGEGYTEFATHVYYEIPYGVNVSAPAVIASFTYDQNYNTITFTDLSTGNINEWYWDFGDGNHSYEQNPIHIYKSPAIYPITLYISNQYQYSNESSEVTISEILTPPSAYFTPARLDAVNPTLPYNVTFTNLSTPTFGCTYNWTVDGGNVSTSQNPSISFATHGVYDIGLTVTNSLGSSTRTYTDAIRLTRKSRTMNEVVGGADTFATFGCHVFVEYPSGSDLPLVYATILPEGVYFIQREIPDAPGIDEWGVRHLYSTINEWGIKIFNTINSWGHKIMHNASSVDRTPLKCIDVEIFEETVIVSDDHQFDEDPS